MTFLYSALTNVDPVTQKNDGTIKEFFN